MKSKDEIMRMVNVLRAEARKTEPDEPLRRQGPQQELATLQARSAIEAALTEWDTALARLSLQLIVARAWANLEGDADFMAAVDEFYVDEPEKQATALAPQEEALMEQVARLDLDALKEKMIEIVCSFDDQSYFARMEGQVNDLVSEVAKGLGIEWVPTWSEDEEV